MNYSKNAGLAFVKSVDNKSARNLLCVNCSQIFSVRDPLHPRGLRCPLVLHCGHSACEKCVRTALDETKRVVCGLCKHVCTPAHEIGDLREDFPLNLYLLGVFAIRHWGQEPEDSKITFVPAGTSNAGRKTSTASAKEQKNETCLECSEREAEWNCLQCEVPYCGPCFTKVHKAARALSKHKKSPLESSPQQTVVSSTMCDSHTEQKLEFYCNECSDMLCSHCIICFHQGHSIITKRQKNEQGMQELEEAREKALEVKKRLLHTQKKVGNVLMVPTPGCNTVPIEQEVTTHFVYLHGVLQLLEQKIMSTLRKTKNERLRNLQSIQNELNSNLQCVKQLIQESAIAKEPGSLDKINIAEITAKLLETQNFPCHLIIEERNTAEPLIRFRVDESFLQLLESHCELEIQDPSLYKLVKTEDLPPDAIVEPIEDEAEQDAVISVSSRTSSVSAISESLTTEPSFTSHKNGTAGTKVAKNKRSHTTDISKGSTEIVTVCHLRDPSSFYVHRVGDAGTLDNLSNQLTKHASTFTSPPDSVIINGLYIVQFHQDKKWYRARVKSVHSLPDGKSENMVDILYIDYGNTETVPASRLRCIPPRFSHTPALALHCSLFGIVPANGKWTQDAVKCLALMVNGTHVKMYVMDYSPDTYQVDLCQIQGQTHENDVPISVRDALVFLEHACFLGEEQYKTPTMDRNVQYFQERDFQKGTVLEVLISHVESPHSFYVQRLGDHARYLSTLMQDMNKEYSNSGNRGLIYKPQIGMTCAANYGVDQRWYRAKIIDLPGKKMVEVFYVDYGNKEVLPWNMIRKLKPQFLRIASQAIPCSMSDVVPKQQQWTQAAAEHIMKVTSGKMLRLYVDGMQRHQLKVTLYRSQDDVDICINGLLVRDGFATSVGVSSSLVEYHKLDGMPLTVPPVTIKGQPTKSLKKKPTLSVKPHNAGDPGEASDLRASTEEMNEPRVEDPFRLEVVVLSCPSPSCLYVTLLNQEAQIKSMMCELQEFYSNSSSNVEKWEVNNKCCVFSVRHKMWYRAIIVDLLPDDQAKVFMKDFAEVETVPILNLQLLDPKFLQIRDGAIKCHLAGVRAAGDKNEWPTLACEFLNELIDKYPNIYIAKKGDIENYSLPVELWVKKVLPGGPLEPTKEEWVTLNSKLIDQGLAIPIRGESEVESIPSLQLLKELDEESREASKNSVSEWLKLSSQVEGSTKTESSEPPAEANNDYSLSDIDEAAVEEEAAAISPRIMDWLPPVPITKKQFKATPTFVDDDGCIYLHDTVQSSDTLTIIGNALHSRFKNSEPKPHDQYWFPNQLCIAQYHSDKKWYRGRVMEVNDDNRIVKVMFVDYGNIEECRASELRKNIYMTDIPIQCHTCRLHGIKPATEDGKWPLDTLDFIHTTIVEKSCLITIKEEPRLGKPYEIKLIGPGNIDIGELLVRMQFAIYSDGFGLDPDARLQSDGGTEDASVIIENEDQLDENEVFEKLETENKTEDDEKISDENEENKTEDDEKISDENEGEVETETENKSVIEENSSVKSLKSLSENFKRDTTISDERIQWIDLIEMEEENVQTSMENGNIRYKMLDLTDNKSILIEVTAILSATELVVHPWESDNPKITKVKNEFSKMSTEMQECASRQPVIRKPYLGQPCCACYTDDTQWYRAAIVAIEDAKSRLKVQYVDYGNMEYLPLNKVHELKPEWAEVPVLGLRCKLWQIRRPEVWSPEKLFPLLMKCMFLPPLVANIKTLRPIMEVELLTEDGTSLACQPLLDEGLLVKDDGEEAKAVL